MTNVDKDDDEDEETDVEEDDDDENNLNVDFGGYKSECGRYLSNSYFDRVLDENQNGE